MLRKITSNIHWEKYSEAKQKSKQRKLTSSCFHRRHYVLSFIKCRQTVIGDFQDPSRIDHAIPRSEIAVNAYRSAMKIFHTLKPPKVIIVFKNIYRINFKFETLNYNNFDNFKLYMEGTILLRYLKFCWIQIWKQFCWTIKIILKLYK